MSPQEWLARQQRNEPEVFDTVSGSGRNVQVDVQFPDSDRRPMSPEEWLASQSAPALDPMVQPRDTSVEPVTTPQGILGAMTRGAAPAMGGAALGAAIGAPIGGVGAIPGAVAGAGAGVLTQVIGDPIVNTVNSLLGTQFTTPTQAMENLLTRLGVAQPQTEAERIVQSTTLGASGAAGFAGAGQAIAAGATNPVTREVGRQLATHPFSQMVAGATGGVASQIAEEQGFGPAVQVGAGVLGGMAGARVGMPRQATQLPSDIEAAEQAGIRVFTSDVVPPRTFAQKWMQLVGERMPVTGTGPARQAQQDSRIAAVQQLARDYGAVDVQQIPRQLWDDLSRTRSNIIARYTGDKNAVIEGITARQGNNARGQQLIEEGMRDLSEAVTLQRQRETMPFPEFGNRAQQIDDRITELRVSGMNKVNQGNQLTADGVTNTVVDLPRTLRTIDEEITRLESLRTSELRPVINILKDWRASVEGQDLANLEQLRRQLGESFKNPELSAVRSIGERSASAIYRPLVEDMGDFIKANGTARDYTKWRVANARLADMMDEMRGTILQRTLRQGDATPEVINSMLFSMKPSEVQSLYRNLSPQGRANARIAIINRAVEKSGGFDNISPDRFANEVNRLGRSINVFFSGPELMRVEGLARALELTKRASAAGTIPNTGAQLFYGGLGISLGGFGGGLSGAAISAGVVGGVGGAARIYESRAVRDILAQMSRVPPDSPQEVELFKRFMAALAVQQQGPSADEE